MTNFKKPGITLSFIQFAADEGKESAINQLEQIKASLETLAEVASAVQEDAAILLLNSVDNAIKEILTTNAVDIAREPYEYLGLDDKFQDGDEAIEKGGTVWFPIVDSVGSTLQEMKHWAIARRPR